MNYCFIFPMYVPCLQTTDISHRSKPKTPVLSAHPENPVTPPPASPPAQLRLSGYFCRGCQGQAHSHSALWAHALGRVAEFAHDSKRRLENSRANTHPCAKILMLTTFPTSNMFNAFECLSAWRRDLLKGPWAPRDSPETEFIGKKRGEMVLSLDFRWHLLHAAGRGRKKYRGEGSQAQTAPWSHAKEVSALVLVVSPSLLLGICNALCVIVTPSFLGYIVTPVLSSRFAGNTSTEKKFSALKLQAWSMEHHLSRHCSSEAFTALSMV